MLDERYFSVPIFEHDDRTSPVVATAIGWIENDVFYFQPFPLPGLTLRNPAPGNEFTTPLPDNIPADSTPKCLYGYIDHRGLITFHWEYSRALNIG